MPRSSVRLHIVERSEGVKGTLFIVLYGYKLLGASNCPEPLLRRLHGSPMCRIETIGQPSERVVPFDYVARLELSGRAENLIETEVPINAEGGFVTTAIGYGLETGAAEIPVTLPGNIVSPPSEGGAEKRSSSRDSRSAPCRKTLCSAGSEFVRVFCASLSTAEAA